jgi:hypothetical protein
MVLIRWGSQSIREGYRERALTDESVSSLAQCIRIGTFVSWTEVGSLGDRTRGDRESGVES